MVISQSHAMCGYVLPNTMNKEIIGVLICLNIVGKLDAFFRTTTQ